MTRYLTMPLRGSSSSYDEGVFNLEVTLWLTAKNPLADGIIGKNQSLEIFAYGTAVRSRKQ